MTSDVILCVYEIQCPPAPLSALTDSIATEPSEGSLSGALRVCVSGDRLTLRDIAAAWPFEGAFHFRAQLSPPGEGHVFLDLCNGPATVVPLLADGSAMIRALPLDMVSVGSSARSQMIRGEKWVWSAADFEAWGLARAARLARSAAAAGDEEGGGERTGGSGGGDNDGGYDDGADFNNRGGDAEGRMREAAAAASAAASAALKSAGAAASAASAAMSSMFGRAAAAVKQRMN
jgi:hypothetical protein